MGFANRRYREIPPESLLPGKRLILPAHALITAVAGCMFRPGTANAATGLPAAGTTGFFTQAQYISVSFPFHPSRFRLLNNGSMGAENKLLITMYLSCFKIKEMLQYER